MDILETGEEKSFIKECLLCRTTFIYKMNDLEPVDGSDLKSVRYIKCPSCDEIIEVDFHYCGLSILNNIRDRGYIYEKIDKNKFIEKYIK